MLFGEELGSPPCEWPEFVDTVLDVPWTAAESPSLVVDEAFDFGPRDVRVCLVRTEWPADDPTARSEEIVGVWRQSGLSVDQFVGREAAERHFVAFDGYMVATQPLPDSGMLEATVRVPIDGSLDVLTPILDSVPPPAADSSN